MLCGNLGCHSRYFFTLIQRLVFGNAMIRCFAVVIDTGMPFVYQRWNVTRRDGAFLGGARSLDEIKASVGHPNSTCLGNRYIILAVRTTNDDEALLV